MTCNSVRLSCWIRRWRAERESPAHRVSQVISAARTRASRQGHQPGSGNMEAKEGGDGWFQSVTERGGQLPSSGNATPACGQHEALARERLAFGQCQFEAALSASSHPLGRVVRQEFYP